jgi:hypothetical protein
MMNMVRNPLVMALVGLLVGLFGGVAIGAGLLLLLDVAPARAPSTPATIPYDIEAIVEEDYINRIMVEAANEMAGPVSFTEGHLDLRPGAVADFAVALELGPLAPVVEGTVGFRATDDGTSLQVLLLDAKMGYLRLTRLIPGGALDDVNADIKRLLIDKLGSQGLRVLDARSDDTTLRIFLGREG